MPSPRFSQVLITGGSGFIGRAVVAEMIQAGHRVVATTTRTTTADLPSSPNLRWVTWEASNEPVPKVEWNTIEAILHLAIPRGPLSFPGTALPLYQTAVSSTFYMLEKARREGIARLLVASSGDALGQANRPVAEDDLLYQPTSFYGCTKACQELLARSYGSMLSTVILRFFHPYGPGGNRFLVNRLFKLVLDGDTIHVEGRDGIPINPVWIDELAYGVRLALESKETGVFHFGGPNTVTLRQLLEQIGELVGREPVIQTSSETYSWSHSATFERTRQALGFDPQISVAAGLRRLAATMDGKQSCQKSAS